MIPAPALKALLLPWLATAPRIVTSLPPIRVRAPPFQSPPIGALPGVEFKAEKSVAPLAAEPAAPAVDPTAAVAPPTAPVTLLVTDCAFALDA
ncbi:MAG: hypothetical protein J0I29_08865, partial [Rhizobiales bacterium]|nr:hypothetical protein [Hyphomicrobiales bacterium]